MSKNSEQQQMDPLADPIVDTITNEPATDETGFITTPFLGMEFQSMSTMGSLQDKSKKGINIHVESVEDAISEVNSFELDFLVMDISIHKQTFQQQKKTSTASQPSLLDLRQICHKHTISSKRYLFRTTDWSHCMVGKVDESAFQAAFGIYNNNNKKLLSSEKPYEVPAIDEYLCGQPSPVKKTKQNNSHAIPSTAGTLSQVHLQAQAAKLIIQQEIQWASHLCLPAVLFPEPQGKEMTIALAQFINKILPSMGSTAVWVRFSAQNYHLWNLMRTMCQSNNLLVPVLDIKNRDIEELAQSCKPAQDGDKKKKKTPNTPETAQHYPQDVFWNPFEKQTFGCENPLVTALSVWIAENVRTIILNLDNFAAPQNNVSHFLNEGLEQFIRKSFKYDIQFIFNTGADSSPNMKIYKRAIMSLFENCPVLSKVEAFSKSFRDFLQRPLQPLIDNLESQTYEVFERDPIKYLLYEQAAEKALVDLYEAKKSKLANDPEALKNMRVITMVLGAGRGPIVKAVLRAARTVNVPVLVYAVEKNPNALSHLLYYRKTIWSTFTQANGHDNLDVPIVEVIQKDMRVWNPPEKADLLVSELLGSFGDNELSPECLDGAQRLLKDNGEGISIPAKYTSYASPLCSYKVWTEVKNLVKSTAFEHSAFETGYVCLVHRGVPLDKPQRCFTFVHPNPQVTEDLKEKEILRDHEDDSSTLHVPLVNNDRYVSLKFKSQQNAVVHGLIGYFDCQLYKDVWMSILPDTFSTGMFSWFPIFFPIENPVIVKKGEDIGVQIWRNCDMDIGRKVWYEWCVTTNGTCSKIHNSQGKHYYISL